MRTVIRSWAMVLLALFVLAACSGPQESTTTTGGQPAASTETTWVRFVHSMPDGPSVDALVGDVEVASNLNYKQWGDWMEVPAGQQDVAIRRGEGIELTDTYDFSPNQRYWIFAWGMINPVGAEISASFAIAPEESIEGTMEETWIRFVNLAAEGEAYGLVVATGGSWTLLFPNQGQGTVSEYKLGPIYDNSFEVIAAHDTSLPPVFSFDQNIQVGLLYTFIVTGRANNDSLEVFHIAESAVR